MRKILIVAMLCVLVVFLYRCITPSSAPKKTDSSPASASRVESPDSNARGAPKGEIAHARGVVERTAESPPRLPGQAETLRVVLDRGPRKPGEHPDRYEDRVWFTKRFDAFVRESGATGAQVQALLLALYDYTMQRRRVMVIVREDLRNGVVVDGEYVDSMFGDDHRIFNQALQRILDVSQRLMYYKHCVSCARHISNDIHYEPPVLRLVDDTL